MARQLVFQWGESDLAFSFAKVDRSKLYGYKEVEVVNDGGGSCELATLADDGSTIVGRGGIGMGYVDADGCWIEKSNLTPVDSDGEEIQPVASSFNGVIKLFDTVTAEDYLNHSIRTVYQLQSEDDVASLRDELLAGTIFSFPYSFRGGLEADAGFLIAGADGHLFLAVGSPTRLEFIGHQHTAAVVDDSETQSDDSDIMSFDMI